MDWVEEKVPFASAAQKGAYAHSSLRCLYAFVICIRARKVTYLAGMVPGRNSSMGANFLCSQSHVGEGRVCECFRIRAVIGASEAQYDCGRSLSDPLQPVVDGPLTTHTLQCAKQLITVPLGPNRSYLLQTPATSLQDIESRALPVTIDAEACTRYRRRFLRSLSLTSSCI